MKLKELKTLLDNQPSVSGNTFLVGSLYVISIILSAIFFIMGVSLLMEAWFDWKIFLDWISRQLKIILNEEQRSSIALSFGIISLFLSVIFAGVIALSRMVLNRNHYIIQLDDWIYQNISQTKKPVRKTKK